MDVASMRSITARLAGNVIRDAAYPAGTETASVSTIDASA
jgi:hypothetical protein